MEKEMNSSGSINSTFSRLKENPESQFFLLTGFWFVFIVLGGFADTFYFNKYSNPVTGHLLIHGIVNTIWILIYLIQCFMISSKNVRLHMLLGKISVIIIFLVFVTGFYTVLYKTAEGRKSIAEAGGNLVFIATGVFFVILGFLKRKNAFAHKRLMLTAMVLLTSAGVDRLILGFWGFGYFPPLVTILSLGPLLVLSIFDKLYLKKFRFLSLGLFVFVLAFRLLQPSKFIFTDKYGQNIIDDLSWLFLW